MTVPAEPARALVLLAKAPVAGRVKTRLHSAFSPGDAATLAQAALEDTLAAMSSTSATHRVVALDAVPPPARLPPGFDVVTQPPGGLGVRLAAAFDRVLERTGHSPALLVGMDTPQSGKHLATVDFADADAVLGLTDDGGYWAIGLREADDRVFDGVPMSTARTGEAQLRRLRDLGLRVRLLPQLRDVDEPADARAVALDAPATQFAAAWRRPRQRPRAALMRPHPMTLYEAALDGEPVVALGSAGIVTLAVARWRDEPDAIDDLMLARCEAPVLDAAVGCGPGRLVAALNARGIPALGIDISARAVQHARRRGATVLRRAVEHHVPAEGRWGTVLLADGNIGIGGDPAALLDRCRAWLGPRRPWSWWRPTSTTMPTTPRH